MWLRQWDRKTRANTTIRTVPLGTISCGGSSASRLPQFRSPRRYLQRGQGSGFIISKDGYILTNNHVVGDVDRMTVTLTDGRTFTDAKVVGTDPDSEVALIKIEGDNFPVLPMGDSDKMAVGDWVIAIGNPFGLTETVTVGVISAVGRSNVHITAYEDFIQTDAAINPGNSGGPLINLDGQAIGINTAIASQSGGYMGIGFAIPINMARTIEEQLRKTGRVIRGYLGMYGQAVTPQMAEVLKLEKAEGILVAQVEKGSPADQAGVKPGDVVLAMNGKPIDSYDVFRNEIATMKPGTKVQFSVMRDGKVTDIPVVLGERPTEAAQARQQQGTPEPQQTLGVEVQNLTREWAQQFGYQPGDGVIVSRVVPGSPADEAGIEPGDLIRSVNRQPVASTDDFGKAITEAKKAGQALLLIQRGEFSQFILVPFGQVVCRQAAFDNAAKPGNQPAGWARSCAVSVRAVKDKGIYGCTGLAAGRLFHRRCVSRGSDHRRVVSSRTTSQGPDHRRGL